MQITMRVRTWRAEQPDRNDSPFATQRLIVVSTAAFYRKCATAMFSGIGFDRFFFLQQKTFFFSDPRHPASIAHCSWPQRTRSRWMGSLVFVKEPTTITRAHRVARRTGMMNRTARLVLGRTVYLKSNSDVNGSAANGRWRLRTDVLPSVRTAIR